MILNLISRLNVHSFANLHSVKFTFVLIILMNLICMYGRQPGPWSPNSMNFALIIFDLWVWLLTLICWSITFLLRYKLYTIDQKVCYVAYDNLKVENIICHWFYFEFTYNIERNTLYILYMMSVVFAKRAYFFRAIAWDSIFIKKNILIL